MSDIALRRRVRVTPTRPYSTIALLVIVLCGCGPAANAPAPALKTAELKPPVPTLNPHPEKTTILKIHVDPGSGVNNVEVTSGWNITNIECAPIAYPEGYRVHKEVDTKEKVDKLNANDYVATIIVDRFLPDNCRWEIGGYDVNYMHDHKFLAGGGAGLAEFGSSNVLNQTCVIEDNPPICWPRSKEAFLRSHFSGIFNTTIEVSQ